MSAVIEVRNLTKRFRVPLDRTAHLKYRLTHPISTSRNRELLALKDVSFDVPEGQFLGIVGANGSDWSRRHYTFSSPGDGIVEAGSIAYPLDQACGTGLEYASDVRAWIYDTAGTRTKPVLIHLVCST